MICVSFGFCGLYSCQGSTLPEETSAPSGMQWPGSAEAPSASSACIQLISFVHVAKCRCRCMRCTLMHFMHVSHCQNG